MQKKILSLIVLFICSAFALLAQTTITIPNGDFSGSGSWQGSPTISNGCGEKYNLETFDVYQELTGLEKGYYKLSANAFYRDGGINNSGSDVVNAYLYAGSSQVPVKSIYSEKANNTSGDGFVSVNGGYIPNNMASAAVTFNAGRYKVETGWVYVGTSGTLKIGVKKPAKVVAYDWTCFDNFQLEYKNSISSTYYLRNRQTGKYLSSGNKSGSQATLTDVGLDIVVYANADGQCAFKIRIGKEEGYLNQGGDGNAYTDMGSNYFYMRNIGGSYYTISKENESKYLTANESNTIISLDGSDGGDRLAQWEFVTKQDLENDLKTASFGKPKDATFLIPAFGFIRRDTRNSLWQGSPTIGGYDDYRHCAEVYNKTFDVYQELTVPNGTYMLSAQAFYRGGNASNARLYATSGSTTNSVPVPLKPDDDSSPNSLAQAAQAFWDGKYMTQQVMVYVDNGKLRIGIKSETHVNLDWTAFDNFRLTYWGEDKITNPYTAATGTYYIQNVATGEYLQGGAEWGVRPTLGNGIDFGIEKVCDGVYNLYSGIKYREGYLCDEEYLDHDKTNFIIQEVSSGVFTIATTTRKCNDLNPSDNGEAGRLLTALDNGRASFASGASGSDAKSQWRFVTEEQRLASLAAATSPTEATFMVRGASMTRDDQRHENGGSNTDPAGYWTTTGHWFYVHRDDGAKKDGAAGIVNSSSSADDVYQTITGLPVGYYEVSAQCCYRNFSNAQLYANNAWVAIDEAGTEFDACFNNSHKDCTCRLVASVQTYGTEKYKKTLTVLVANGTLRLGVRGEKSDGNNLLIFDNFRLTYKGNIESTEYYVRNVATKEYIRVGETSNKLMTDKWGLNLRFIKKEGNQYAVYTDISKTENNCFLDASASADGPETYFEIVKSGDYYTIKNNSDYLAVNPDKSVTFQNISNSNQNAQWELLTRDQLIAELKSSGASDANPVNATSLIKAPNFGRDDLRNNNDNWSDIDFKSNQFGGADNYVVEKFKTEFDTYQTVSGLPAGVYELSLQAFYRSGNLAQATESDALGNDVLRPFVYAKQNGNYIGMSPVLSIFDTDVTTQISQSGFNTKASNGKYVPNSLKEASMVFRDGYYKATDGYNKVRFVVPADGTTIQIGLKKNILKGDDWIAFDNFELMYLGAPQNGESQTVYEYEVGTEIGPVYLKNRQTQTYLTAGGSDGVSAVLGDKMYQHSVYENTDKYNKGVRETDFTFLVIGANKMIVNTGIGGGLLQRNNGAKVNGSQDGDNVFFGLKLTADGYYYITHTTTNALTGAVETRYLRHTDSEATDTEVMKVWNFKQAITTVDEFNADTDNWTKDSGTERWTYNPATENAALQLGDGSLPETEGLLFKAGKEKILISPNSYLRLNGGNIDIVIPGLKAGQIVTIKSKTANPNQSDRYLKATSNLNVISGFAENPGTGEITNIGEVAADGSVTVTSSAGLNIYSIEVAMPVTTKGVGFELFSSVPDATNYQWELQTKQQIIDNEFGTASADNPVDATFLLRGTAFHKDDSRNNSWKGVQTVGGEGGPNGEVHPNYVAEVNERTYFDVNQKITGVPNGVYEYTLQGYFKETKGGKHTVNNNTIYYTSTDGMTFINKNVNNKLSHIKASYYPADFGLVQPDCKYEASTLFEMEHSSNLHDPIRFKVENGTIILGVYRCTNVSVSHPTLYMDNVRLTYLGEEATGYGTPIDAQQGIKHKPSRYYDLAEEDGNLTLDRTTYKASNNKTTLSDEAMEKHAKTGRWIQNTPLYEETIYAMAGQKLKIVMPNSYSDENQSSGRYYQRFYDYKTDGLFVEDATTNGTFEFNNDATVRQQMRVYEGTAEAPAGGMLFGNRWNNQMAAKFNFTTPTNFADTIMIGVDHSDFTDIGDMSMFGNLTEPTLGQRLVYNIVPASKMVDQLADCTGEKYLEEKIISFPTIWHGLKSTDYNAVALDKQLKNYFTDAGKVPEAADFTIELEAGNTGITLADTEFSGNTSRFIRFKYPDGNVVTNYANPAYIYVKSNGKNIAKFTLRFEPNTELRPWKDIIGQGNMRRSPVYMDEHAVLMEQLNFDYSYSTISTDRSTWPVGDVTAINGVEEEAYVSNWDQFNPYPLNFDQTSFAAYYPRAIWGQYSVMKSLCSYNIVRSFKDVNQLYHDHYESLGNVIQTERYRGDGYFMYIDASNFPSSVATLNIDEELCEGTTIHFSGWVSSMDASTSDNAPGNLLFSILGKKGDGTFEAIESFCPGPIRADAMSYNDGHVKANVYNNELWGDASRSIWQQFAFSFVINADDANKYSSFALKIDNNCSRTSGGDMMVDDVRLYIQKAVPDIMQNTPVCNAGELSSMEIYTTFEQLLDAVNKTETENEMASRVNNCPSTNPSNNTGYRIIPQALYCFLDKDIYDRYIREGEGATNAFNAALVTTGGNDGGGYYKHDFSYCFASNDGGDSTFKNNNEVNYRNTAMGEVIYAQDGTTVLERRIYLNPPAQGLLSDGEVSLNEMAYYTRVEAEGSPGYRWISSKPEWNMNESSSIIYGHNDGDPIRYADLSGYEQLRIYQTEGNPVRCFFIYSKDSMVTVSSTTYPEIIKRASDSEPWIVDLAALKTEIGQLKLIGIKAATKDEHATASNITLYKSSGLEADKDYYIVFRAATGEAGEATIDNPADFFLLENEKCASMAEFRLKAGTEVRFDGILSYEGGNVYCAGQVATMKVEMQGLDANNELIKQEDLFYDWWIGTEESFVEQQSGKPDSPKDVLYLFRDAYPEATIYDGHVAKDEFTESHRQYLEELITPQGGKAARLHLYQASLNAVVDATNGSEMTVIVVPIESQLKELTGLQFCNEPMNLTIKVTGQGPTVSGGFEGTEYPTYIIEQPLRIGLKQIEQITDNASNQWNPEDAAMYIPLRDLQASDGKYITFEKKVWTDGTTLDIAAVYLSETNDPDMISYEEVNGIKEMRFVGKIHKFEASKDKNGAYESYVQMTLNPEFQPKEGYRYTLKTSFVEMDDNNEMNSCHGDLILPMYIVPEYQVWTGGAGNNDWANNKNWRRADNHELDNAGTAYAASGRLTNEQNTTSEGMVPMSFTRVLMPASDGSQHSYPVLDNVVITDGVVDFNGSTTQTEDIEYYLEANNNMPSVTSWVPRDIDLYCAQFYNNTCDEINFSPRSQMLNTQYLTYNRAWVEYELESDRWYTLASPLKGVVSGDMYLPRNTAKQQTPYFTDITYDNGNYSRLLPAVYQQSWDKAEALTYRLEQNQFVDKLPPALEANTAKVNVARAFNWSNEYNDVKVPFGINGFSVRVDVSRIDGYDKGSGNDVLLRLPKSDRQYSYFMYDDATSGSATVDLTTTEVDGKMLRENAGKLFTDDMKSSGNMSVTLVNNSADNPYFLVGNPFMSALDLDKFFEVNDSLDKTYWILTEDSYITGVKNEGQHWLTTDGTAAGDIAPLQAFFVRKSNNTGGTLNVNFTGQMAVAATTADALQTRSARTGATAPLPALRITAVRGGLSSSALVVCSDKASDGYKAGEDAEALFDSNLAHAPMVYTLAGDMAAAVNVRRGINGLPLGLESEDESNVTLFFDGVENYADALYVYDAVEGRSMPVHGSGSGVNLCGKAVGRYYLVTSDVSGDMTDNRPVITVDGNMVTIVSVPDAIRQVVVNDVAGRHIYSADNVGNTTNFTLPNGVYIINVRTEKHNITHKVVVR